MNLLSAVGLTLVDGLVVLIVITIGMHFLRLLDKMRETDKRNWKIEKRFFFGPEDDE